MPSITLRQAGVKIPSVLFQEISLTLGDSDRLGLVAGNGGGKSTLLRCLAGQAELTHGDITRSRGLRIGFVAQDVPENLLDLPLTEAIRRALDPALRETETWRVGVVLDEFETPDDLRDRPLRALSGGWQRLALIARAWIAEPDALLLDEPTNHLDLAKIEWLESWLRDPARRVPMVIASHDRRFLDACTTRTLFLRPEISPLFAHPYAKARALLADSDAAQSAKLARDTNEAARLRRSANELKNIGINSRSDHAQRKSMLMAQRAEDMEQSLRPVHVDRSADIRLESRPTHAKVLVSLDDVTICTPTGQTLFATGRLKIFQGDRIVIAGPNGVGKSQFLSALRRAALQPDSVPGLRVSPSAVLGYVDQQMAQLPADDTPFGFISSAFRLGDQRSRSLLAGAGFPVDRQTRPIAQLSPGQKARLGLLALRLTEPNFYLLDEPTNHVDIAGQERLESELLAQESTCVIVSHDRSFVAAIGTRYLHIQGGRLREA